MGSQRVSSIGYAKAKELLAAGEIGKLNMVNAIYDRQSSIGAWEYTIPKDADAITTNWDRFIEVTNKYMFFDFIKTINERRSCKTNRV